MNRRFILKIERKIMQFIQARRLDNKLHVRDNRPYTIDKVQFINGGFALTLTNDIGQEVYLTYNSLDWFREDFNIVNSIKELEEYKQLKEV